MNREDAVIAAIDALERDDVDALVDWQLTDSPAARTEQLPPQGFLTIAIAGIADLLDQLTDRSAS